jgi:hypothetical protein
MRALTALALLLLSLLLLGFALLYRSACAVGSTGHPVLAAAPQGRRLLWQQCWCGCLWRWQQ